MYICVPCGYLVPMEVTRVLGTLELEVGAGNQPGLPVSSMGYYLGHFSSLFTFVDTASLSTP